MRAFLGEAGWGTGDPSEDLSGLMKQVCGSKAARAALAESFGIDAANAEPDKLADMCVDSIVRNAVGEAGIRVRTVYRVRPEGGVWTAGHQHQAELAKTDSLRFVRGGEETNEYVVYYNLTAAFESFSNMRLWSGLVYVPAAEVEGVSLNDGLLKTHQEDDGAM